MKRQILFTKDVQIITGKGDRYCRNLLARIRKRNKKLPGQFVTVEEFCNHSGLEKEIVMESIKSYGKYKSNAILDEAQTYTGPILDLENRISEHQTLEKYKK